MMVPALEPLVAGVSHNFGMQHSWNPTRKRLLYFLSKGIYEYMYIYIYFILCGHFLHHFIPWLHPQNTVTVTVTFWTIGIFWIRGSQKTRLSDLTTTERSGSEMPGMLGPSETSKKKKTGSA